MPGRKWTLQDDALLRKFHAEGKDDPTIGYILGRNRKFIFLKRKALGLKAVGIPGVRKGTFRHTEAHKAMMRKLVTRRWREDEAFQKAALEALDRGRAKGWATVAATRFRIPQDPRERYHYQKIQRHLGTPAARQALGSPQRPVQRFHEPT